MYYWVQIYLCAGIVPVFYSSNYIVILVNESHYFLHNLPFLEGAQFLLNIKSGHFTVFPLQKKRSTSFYYGIVIQLSKEKYPLQCSNLTFTELLSTGAARESRMTRMKCQMLSKNIPFLEPPELADGLSYLKSVS